MCGGAPKVKEPKPKEVQYLRNPWLDGLAIGGLGGRRSGRNSLRIDLATPAEKSPLSVGPVPGYGSSGLAIAGG